jgi:hypothetical protein
MTVVRVRRVCVRVRERRVAMPVGVRLRRRAAELVGVRVVLVVNV